jgi:hypothetical protein
MQKHRSLWTFLILVMIAGLVSGFFIGPIRKALTMPMMQMMHTTAMSAPPGKATHAAPTVSAHTQTPNGNATGNAPMNTQVLAQDTFQRTNQQLWGTASDGDRWAGDANQVQAFSIQQHSGQISATQGALNAVLGPAQMNVQVRSTVEINGFNGGAANIGVVLRWTDANDWYKAYISGTQLILLKSVAGKQTQIQAVPFAAQGGQDYTIRFQCNGDTLQVKAWASGQAEPQQWMINATDNTLQSGQAGLRAVLTAGTVIRITTFMVQPTTTTAT